MLHLAYALAEHDIAEQLIGRGRALGALRAVNGLALVVSSVKRPSIVGGPTILADGGWPVISEHSSGGSGAGRRRTGCSGGRAFYGKVIEGRERDRMTSSGAVVSRRR